MKYNAREFVDHFKDLNWEMREIAEGIGITPNQLEYTYYKNKPILTRYIEKYERFFENNKDHAKLKKRKRKLIPPKDYNLNKRQDIDHETKTMINQLLKEGYTFYEMQRNTGVHYSALKQWIKGEQRAAKFNLDNFKKWAYKTLNKKENMNELKKGNEYKTIFKLNWDAEKIDPRLEKLSNIIKEKYNKTRTTLNVKENLLKEICEAWNNQTSINDLALKIEKEIFRVPYSYLPWLNKQIQCRFNIWLAQCK
jgi:hypothetical protein